MVLPLDAQPDPGLPPRLLLLEPLGVLRTEQLDRRMDELHRSLLGHQVEVAQRHLEGVSTREAIAHGSSEHENSVVRDFCDEGVGSSSGEELILRLARRILLAVRDATERYVDDRVVLVAELEHGD